MYKTVNLLCEISGSFPLKRFEDRDKLSKVGGTEGKFPVSRFLFRYASVNAFGSSGILPVNLLSNNRSTSKFGVEILGIVPFNEFEFSCNLLSLEGKLSGTAPCMSKLL
eukprot:NODE_139_length_17940_cov_0.254190.p10 type:complete len:109 gc:universal NODE_139_length_17940_cov_0.254190:6540-6866(+)